MQHLRSWGSWGCGDYVLSLCFCLQLVRLLMLFKHLISLLSPLQLFRVGGKKVTLPLAEEMTKAQKDVVTRPKSQSTESSSSSQQQHSPLSSYQLLLLNLLLPVRSQLLLHCHSVWAAPLCGYSYHRTAGAVTEAPWGEVHRQRSLTCGLSN